MNNKNFQGTNESKDEWNENDILSDDMFSLSNISNMISMSSNPNMSMPNMVNTPVNPNMYTANMPTLLNINSEEALQKSTQEKNFSNKK
jgi:hypothetical protein